MSIAKRKKKDTNCIQLSLFVEKCTIYLPTPTPTYLHYFVMDMIWNWTVGIISFEVLISI